MGSEHGAGVPPTAWCESPSPSHLLLAPDHSPGWDTYGVDEWWRAV